MKFVNTDFSRKGYEDALANYDNTHKQARLQIISGQLVCLFKEVTDYYQSEISDLNVRITKCTKDGLLDIADKLEKEKNIREEKISELEKMKNDFDANEVYMCIMLRTYEIGFNNGIAAQLLPQKS